jgi:hypothetical protein
MNFTACCPELEKLLNKRPGEDGLGLTILIHSKLGTRFILEYRKDWGVAASSAATKMKFCPYCGSELKLAPLPTE